MRPRLVVTTSWDDGHPADVRLAELLLKRGVAGTFYVPNRNLEGRPTLAESDIRRISENFELGGHSVDHIVLTQLNGGEAARQIRDNKRWLEDVTAKPVDGFCYVRGRYNPTLKAIVQQLGFQYARTVANFHAYPSHDAYELPTTVQFFPHNASVFAKNYLRGPWGRTRSRLAWAALTSGDLEQRIARLIKICDATGGYFHLWGHSWEIEEHGLWSTLDDVLARLAEISDSISFATNREVYSKHLRRGQPA